MMPCADDARVTVKFVELSNACGLFGISASRGAFRMKRVDNAINVLLDKKHVCASTWTKLNATSALFFSRDAAPLVAIDGIFSRQFRVGSRAGPRGIFVFPSARSPDSSAGIRESEIAGALSLSLSLSLSSFRV